MKAKQRAKYWSHSVCVSSQRLCFPKFALFIIIGGLSFLLILGALVYVGVLTPAQENECSANGSWHKTLLLPYFCCLGAKDTHKLRHKCGLTINQATMSLHLQVNIATCLHTQPAVRTHSNKETLVSLCCCHFPPYLREESWREERSWVREVFCKRFPWVLRIRLVWKGLMELNWGQLAGQDTWRCSGEEQDPGRSNSSHPYKTLSGVKVSHRFWGCFFFFQALIWKQQKNCESMFFIEK